ncbi:MAG: ParB/RepB/Spo0J family partition protein [Candidatus Sulfotelmatobacter sp.]
MNNTAAAGKVAGQAADKDKVEKRRALGRGLASLLPGPRVVPPPAAPATTESQNPHPVGHEAARQGRGTPTHDGVPAPGEQQVPPFVGNDNAAGAVTADETFSSEEISEPLTIQAQAEPARVPGNLVINVAISDIDKNPFQTRYVQDDDALEELANSIQSSGVVQPILVRPSEDDETRYILILGERRLHASKKAGKTHIPALVRKVSLQQAAEMTIVENLQREDLSPLEQAEAFRVLSNQFKLTQEEIGARVGLSRVSVANYMRLLKLPREVMEMLVNKTINFAKAKELLKLEGNDRIAEAALYAVKKGMNLEQVEMLVLRMEGLLDPLPDMPGVIREKKSSGARWVDPNVKAAQLDLERMLGVRVRIRDRKGRGKIVIEYSTVDDYDRVVEMLRGKK